MSSWCVEPKQHRVLLQQQHCMKKSEICSLSHTTTKWCHASSALVTDYPDKEETSRFLSTAQQFSSWDQFFLLFGTGNFYTKLIRFLLRVKSQIKDFLYLKISCFIYRKARSTIMFHNIWLQFIYKGKQYCPAIWHQVLSCCQK